MTVACAAHQAERPHKEEDLVSVIIPTYNGSRFLLGTVESALQQTHSPIEIIVVDDGSTEDMKAVLEPVRNSVTFLRQENKGPAAARNHGLRACSGSYVAFIDHDDVWPPDKTAAQLAIMKSDPECGLVYSYPRLIDAEGRQIVNEEPTHFPSGDVLLDFAMRNRITTFSATLFRRSVFEDVGYLNESSEVVTADDYEIYLRLAEKYKVLYCAQSPPYYRLHDGNMAKNYLLNYSATVAVLEQLLHRHRSRSDLRFMEKLTSAVNANLTRLAARYAYILYYSNDRKNACALFRKAYMGNPWALDCLIYLILCVLPGPTLTQLKAMRKLCCFTRP